MKSHFWASVWLSCVILNMWSTNIFLKNAKGNHDFLPRNFSILKNSNFKLEFFYFQNYKNFDLKLIFWFSRFRKFCTGITHTGIPFRLSAICWYSCATSGFGYSGRENLLFYAGLHSLKGFLIWHFCSYRTVVGTWENQKTRYNKKWVSS